MTPDASTQERISRVIAHRVAALQLDLRGLNVLTEAATGAYAVTPVIAAAAGASVTALAKPSKFGDIDEARRQVLDLAAALNVASQIRVVDALNSADIGQADVVTNTGHLRPLDAAFIGQMKHGAVVPLMYESWELRSGDVDLAACKTRGIRVAGTNECHPNIRVFEYLGMLAVLGLLNCQVPICFSKLLLICDNPFAPYIAKTLCASGAELDVFADTPIPESIPARRRAIAEKQNYDAVIIASTPGAAPTIGHSFGSTYTIEQIGTFSALVQLWGDVDRSCLRDVVCYPVTEPRKGHMGILLSEIGPEPIIRLQAGGLKVGGVLSAGRVLSVEDREYCQMLEPETCGNL